MHPRSWNPDDDPAFLDLVVTRVLESNAVLLLFERSLRKVLFTKSSVTKAVTQTQFETCITAFMILISWRGPYSNFSFKVTKWDLTLDFLTNTIIWSKTFIQSTRLFNKVLFSASKLAIFCIRKTSKWKWILVRFSWMQNASYFLYVS